MYSSQYKGEGMKSSREFMPGDEVKINFSPAESEGETNATVVSRMHDGKVEVEFKNGKTASIQAGDLTRLDR